jgi:hypothetical protein
MGDVADWVRAVTVVQQAGTPALWQAPTALADSGRVTGNATVTLVAAVPGQNLYVFGWTIVGDGPSAVSGTLARIVRHSDGAMIGGFGVENFGSTTLQSEAWGSGFHGGLALGVGAGVDLVIDTQPTSGGIRAAISYAQG